MSNLILLLHGTAFYCSVLSVLYTPPVVSPPPPSPPTANLSRGYSQLYKALNHLCDVVILLKIIPPKFSTFSCVPQESFISPFERQTITKRTCANTLIPEDPQRVVRAGMFVAF